MKTKICFGIVGMALALALIGRADNPRAEVSSNAPEVKNLSEAKWDKILPDLGENSPEICILRIDPKTHATSLLIRTPKAIHVRSTGTPPMKHIELSKARLRSRTTARSSTWARVVSISCLRRWFTRPGYRKIR